jgi:transcriptional regulator with GAF, ATPase, and Fis domain
MGPDPAQSAPHTEASLDPRRPLGEAGRAWSAERFRALYEIGRLLLEQREPEALLDTIHGALIQHLRPDRACILSWDQGEYRARRAHGLDVEGAPEGWPLSWTVVRHVRERELAVLASDVKGDAQLADAGSIQRFRIRSVLCVPLGHPARGALYLDNRSERPFSEEDLEFLTGLALYASLVLERTDEHARTSQALRRSDEHRAALEDELLRHEIVGRSPALLAAFDTLRRLARGGARVLLRGETGTGKELFARAYAAHSGRSGYVPVTIPALAPTLVESELFGHVKGAFTEAARDKKGRLEVAHGGVLFLDEVGDVEPGLQAKLLRFLDSGELYRVGDVQGRKVDALVVSATNRPLEKDVEGGRFRADLLARLGHAVSIPPLRERVDDVPLLVAHFLERYGRQGARKVFADEAMALLQRHSWPFNVRELQQVVERAVCLVDHEVVRPDDLPDYLRRGADPKTAPAAASEAGPPRPLKRVVEETEKAHILRTLEFTKGNRRRAIELLRVSPETFYRRLEEFGLHRKGGDDPA